MVAVFAEMIRKCLTLIDLAVIFIIRLFNTVFHVFFERFPQNYNHSLSEQLMHLQKNTKLNNLVTHRERPMPCANHSAAQLIEN